MSAQQGDDTMAHLIILPTVLALALATEADQSNPLPRNPPPSAAEGGRREAEPSQTGGCEIRREWCQAGECDDRNRRPFDRRSRSEA